MIRRASLSLPLLMLAVVACSSSSTTVAKEDAGGKKDGGKKPPVDATASTESGTPDSSSGGGSDVHPDVIIDPNNCVAPGTPSGDNGIGGYCSPAGGQCNGVGLGGAATICTADIGAPMHEWFCTSPCADAGMCGGGGMCLEAPFGEICVPSSCAKMLGDASSDLIDAPVDAPTDTGHHEAAVDAHSSGHDGGHDGGHDAGAHPDAAGDAHKDAAIDAKAD